jgi:hypothetical protein
VIALVGTACGTTADETKTFDDEDFEFTFEYPANFGDSERVSLPEHADTENAAEIKPEIAHSATRWASRSMESRLRSSDSPGLEYRLPIPAVKDGQSCILVFFDQMTEYSSTVGRRLIGEPSSSVRVRVRSRR